MCTVGTKLSEMLISWHLKINLQASFNWKYKKIRNSKLIISTCLRIWCEFLKLLLHRVIMNSIAPHCEIWIGKALILVLIIYQIMRVGLIHFSNSLPWSRILIYTQRPVKIIVEPLNHGVSRTSSVTRSFERLIFPHLHNKFSGKKSAVHTNS